MQTITRRGKKFVLVPVAEYERLTTPAMPALPKADARGNRPAVAFARATIARQIIRDREAIGLSQIALARRAGIRPETLNRIEKGHTTPDTATLAKIDAALNARPRGARLTSVRKDTRRRG
jgi:ribosome-binding protein aMBF1 (putative translation factor)